jgi:hypothetical protein
MSQTLQVEADLAFSVEVDGVEMAGTLRGSGTDLELTVDDPRLLGGSGTGPARALADQLARRGIRLAVTAHRPLVRLGVPRTSFWQRRITGSPHIEVASVGAAVRLLRLRRTSSTRTPLVPPPSPLPLLPTFLRRPRRPTTTHDPDGGGYPRLVMAPGPYVLPGQQQPVYHLGARTTIGSDPRADIVLVDLRELHAEVRRTEDDEFVLVPLAGKDIRVNGAVVATTALLRTGARVEIGGATLSFFREEYADHGRPYGGRVGGELGRNRAQPSREELDRDRP